MDDLKFRRRAYADPDCQDEDFIEYKNASEENRLFVDDLQNMNESLTQALQVTPPAELKQRISLSQSFTEHQQNRRKWQFISIAASLFLTFAIVFHFSTDGPSLKSMNLAEEYLQHVYHELNHLHEQQMVDLHTLNQALAGVGISLSEEIGQVNYLGSCEIARNPGVHIVLQGERGPVTIMLVPGAAMSGQRLIREQRFDGVIVPAAGGSMAIIGEKGEPLMPLKSRLQQLMYSI